MIYIYSRIGFSETYSAREARKNWQTNRPTDRFTNQLTDQQPTNWQTNQPTNKPTNQPTNRQTDLRGYREVTLQIIDFRDYNSEKVVHRKTENCLVCSNFFLSFLRKRTLGRIFVKWKMFIRPFSNLNLQNCVCIIDMYILLLKINSFGTPFT